MLLPLLATLALAPPGDPPMRARLVQVARIWDRAPHCAFTDLLRWKGSFWCAFREGSAHVSPDGRIRVLVSRDGASWRSSALIALAGHDLRDADLSIAPDGRLMLLGGAAARRARESAPTATFACSSTDGEHWEPPRLILDPGRWLWRITWHGGRAWGVCYGGNRPTALLVSRDGRRFKTLLAKMCPRGRATEAVLRFAADEICYCLQRRDGKAPDNTALLGTSRPPYKTWSWRDLGAYLGGPNFLQLPGGGWIAAGRRIGAKGARTELLHLDVKAARMNSLLELPSGGDTSYPGLLWYDGRLWMSYYSSHEKRTGIYLACIEIKASGS